MKPFMDEEFLLETETAQRLYHDYAEKMPIVDYHCHISPREIAENRRFENITQVWLGGTNADGSVFGDHYKWRQMRANGVPEQFVTGDAPDEERFYRWAQTLESAVGNPLYHWSHLELRRYFGYEGVLNRRTAPEVWDLCNEKLAQDSMRTQRLISDSNVRLLCTTDDPIDTLEWHQKIEQNYEFDVKVLPAWRPDKAVHIEAPGWRDYAEALSKASGIPVSDWPGLQEALSARMDFFARMGCRASDHAVNWLMYRPADERTVDSMVRRALAGEELREEEALQFQTAMLVFLSQEYRRRDWAMQLHFGCRRNNNSAAYAKLGPDTGYDCISNYAPADEMARLLDAMERAGGLPKTILYSLNPADNVVIQSVMGCFQDGSFPGKLQHGSAWWFNDHKAGMEEQLTSLANEGLLARFIGMLTDSRSFLSYPRHEYFRRILCNLLGSWVESGQYPADYEVLGRIVEDICFNNAVRYFGLPLQKKSP